MTPLIFPPLANAAWANAKEIVVALLAHAKRNPFIVAAVVDAFAESWWEPGAIGDNGQSFGPWQLKAQFYAAPILAGTGIDIRLPSTTLAEHVEAVLYALAMPENQATLTALDAATTGADATRIWCANFERASAAGAVERRVAAAPQIEVWLAGLTSPTA